MKNKAFGDIYSTNMANSDFINKNEISPSKELYDDLDRDTIQVNVDQNIGQGLEDMIFDEIKNNKDGVQINTGRESEKNHIQKNKLQMAKYGINIENTKNNEDSKHADKLKSSDNLILSFNATDKLNQLAENNSNNIIIEGNNEGKENKNIILEMSNNSQINLEHEKIEENAKKEKKDEKEENQNKINLNIEKNPINIEDKKEDKKEDEKKDEKENEKEVEKEDENNANKANRKRTIVDIGPNKLSASKVLGIINENNEEIKNREKRIQTFKAENNSSYSAIGKRHGFISLKDQEIENNNYDYYSLFLEDYVKNKLNEEHDQANEKNIYSDQIFLLSDKKKLDKKLILLTPSNIFFIEEKGGVFSNKINRNEINRIAISNQNLNILALILNKNEENIIILTLRRMDLLYYLRDFYRKSEKPLRFVYQDNFNINIKGKNTQLSAKDKTFTTLSNFDGAIKIGYLQKKSFLFKSFNQRLVVLTSIGLIVFDDPTKPPERLYPIINSQISKVSFEKYKKANCFEIITLAGEIKVFAAYKEREMNSWIEEFKKVKEDFKIKMKKLDTTNKVEFIDNNNALPNVNEEQNEEELIPQLDKKDD